MSQFRRAGTLHCQSMTWKACLACAMLSLLLGSTAFPDEIRLRLEEPVGLNRTRWPVETGLPFAQGKLKNAASVRVISPSKKAIPVQTRVLSRWRDGSIRWLHVLFQADLEAQAVGTWRVAWNPAPPAADADGSVRIVKRQEGFSIHTGAMDAEIGGGGFHFLKSVTIDGTSIVDSFRTSSLRLVTAAGEVFESSLDPEARTTVEEEGPLRAVLRVDGRHRSPKGETLFEYTARLTFHAGKSWCEVEYAFTDKETEEATDLREVTALLRLAPGKGPFQGTSSEIKVDRFWKFDRPFRIYAGKGDLAGVFGGARIFQHDGSEIVGPGYESEARARWWADASDGQRGVSVSIEEMSQNFPKAIRVSEDSVAIDLYPATEQAPLHFRQGWRKTQKMLLYFHRGNAEQADARALAFNWQTPVIPWTKHFVGSGAAGSIMPYQPKKYPMIERALRDAFVAYEGGVGQGMIDYGDTRGSGSGERGEFWANNAYDTPWAAYLMFFRTGERRYWTRARAAARHTADIDVVHHSARNSVEVGGVRIHGPQHVQYNSEGIAGSSVAPNHEWLEGLVTAWHLTGEARYLDAARAIGDHLLRAIDAGWILPPYNARWNGARNLGWPLLALTVIYDETGDVRYLEGARRVLAGMQQLQMENGSFPIWIGPYKAAAPLHNAIAMEALGRYAAVTGDAQAKAVYMKCAQSTMRDLVFPDGELMYITHADYRSGYRGMPWGGFHYGYLYTGDRKYLEFPLPLVMEQLRSRNFGVYGEGAMSYGMRGILFYLNFADKAGILKDLPRW